uniref:Uncharacterized protein n=1 Tax=Rhizophora mucronata TaxID=61149 RepID=A0A2P2NU08_RHIMU
MYRIPPKEVSSHELLNSNNNRVRAVPNSMQVMHCQAYNS